MDIVHSVSLAAMSILRERVFQVMPAGMTVVKPQVGYAQRVDRDKKMARCLERRAILAENPVSA
ncbi:hypothetical protein DNF23_49150 [Pseudomonas syringae pv. pisi]|jgi:hypothetical protein|uniref:hypothetical protein n=1 Tax=Massilia timonae TaxID=47229 RepID=UPI000D8EBB50|nr:hypothetical protein [Massilia timonae]